MQLPTAIVLMPALTISAGLLNTGRPPRRALGFILGCLPLVVPFWVETAPHILPFLSMVGLMVALRSWDLVQDPETRSAGQRLWHLFALFDTRQVQSIERTARTDLLKRAAVAAVIAAGALALTLSVVNPTGPVDYALRWGSFVVFMLAVFEFGSATLRFAYALGGISPPRMHNAPYLSRTVREFWGERWNLIIHTWLKRNCFLPLARRGHVELGLVWAFTFSAFMHAYLILAAAGWVWAALYGLFFLIQIAIVMVERVMKVSRWPSPVARVWTWAVLLATSPLFSEPIIRLVEVDWPQ